MLSIDDWSFIQHLARTQCGHKLMASQQSAIEHKLDLMAQTCGFGTIDGLICALRADDLSLVDQTLEIFIDKQTGFFNNKKVFDYVKDHLLPELRAKRQQSLQPLRPLRLWCAGCSTGQEAYSLAILLCEAGFDNDSAGFEIIATDICEASIQIAKNGIYTDAQIITQIPDIMLGKYFNRYDQGWIVNDYIKKYIKFYTHNLLISFGAMDYADMIICRDVLKNFCSDLKNDVLRQFTNLMQIDSYLILNPHESLLGSIGEFKPAGCQQGIYVITHEQKAGSCPI